MAALYPGFGQFSTGYNSCRINYINGNGRQGRRRVVNQLLVINDHWLGRITVVLVDEALGF
jgi:hypothetical protein